MTSLPTYLLPDSATIDAEGELSIGGRKVSELAETYGTPLFIYDAAELKGRCKEAYEAFGDGVAYATKAFLCKAMAKLAHEQGMHLDVATGGELFVARAAGVPGERLVLHGNNKSSDELAYALKEGVGRIVVDSNDELDRIEALVAQGMAGPHVLVRITPGVEAHTHEYVQTGQEDTKFGFSVHSGAAEAAVRRCQDASYVHFRGLHCHIGSQIFTTESFLKATGVVAEFANRFDTDELSIGGGLGVPYVDGEHAPSIREWGQTLKEAVRTHGVTAKIVAEPGRSIAAKAGITVYRVGTIKDLPGIRTYVAVDGGMSDNPRPVLYGSGYETFVPTRASAPRPNTVTLVGKHCESGDLLVRDGKVPADLKVGDLIATPVTGAYGHTMASNYNKVPRPAVLFVEEGEVTVAVRRETYEDLIRCDN